MGARLAVLVLLLLALLWGGPALAAADSCSACHPVHYAERGACSDCHRGNPRTARIAIAHHELIAGRFAHFTLPESPVVKGGVQRMEDAACRRCHVAGGKGNRLAVNLDGSPHTARPGELFEAIRTPVLYMPDFRLTDGQIVAVVNAIFFAAAQAPSVTAEVPVVVHFEALDPQQENLFVKHCGACHRMLSDSHGGLGTGAIGPNLSGLLSDFYPKTFREAEGWSAEGLKKWLKNPRSVRPLTVMAPVVLREEEIGELVKMFAGPNSAAQHP